MLDIKVQIKPSLERVGDAFRAIRAGAALQKGIEKFGWAIERESKRYSPVDTGRMRASITTDIGNLRARIAPNVVYAGFVHEGTRYMKGRPFMRWGVEAAEPEAPQGIKAEVEAEIDSKLSKAR